MKAKQSVKEMIDYDPDNVWHVKPVNDLKKHHNSMMCWCNPKVELQENRGLIVVHNSYDMREYRESGAKWSCEKIEG